MVPRGGFRNGFTMMELLAVTAMIAGLTVIAFSIPYDRRGCTRGVSCLSNAKQLTIALLMYVQDYDERLPPHAYVPANPDTALPFLLLPYIKNRQVFRCPTDPQEASAFDGTPADGTVSYGYNWLALSPRGRGVRYRDVKKPGETVTFVDSASYLATPTPLLILGGTPPAARHLDFVTVGWLDGHVKAGKRIGLEERAPAEEGRPERMIDRYRYWNRR